ASASWETAVRWMEAATERHGVGPHAPRPATLVERTVADRGRIRSVLLRSHTGPGRREHGGGERSGHPAAGTLAVAERRAAAQRAVHPAGVARRALLLRLRVAPLPAHA